MGFRGVEKSLVFWVVFLGFYLNTKEKKIREEIGDNNPIHSNDDELPTSRGNNMAVSAKGCFGECALVPVFGAGEHPNVPSFLFLARENIRICPRSCLWYRGTSAKTTFLETTVLQTPDKQTMVCFSQRLVPSLVIHSESATVCGGHHNKAFDNKAFYSVSCISLPVLPAKAAGEN